MPYFSSAVHLHSLCLLHPCLTKLWCQSLARLFPSPLHVASLTHHFPCTSLCPCPSLPSHISSLYISSLAHCYPPLPLHVPSLPHPHFLAHLPHTLPLPFSFLMCLFLCTSLPSCALPSHASSLTCLFPHAPLPLHVSSLQCLFPHVSLPISSCPLCILVSMIWCLTYPVTPWGGTALFSHLYCTLLNYCCIQFITTSCCLVWYQSCSVLDIHLPSSI